MSKELQQRISQLEEELYKLKKAVESSKKESSSLLTSFDKSQEYHLYGEDIDYPGFDSFDHRDSWMQALDTFFKLRYQEGSEVAVGDEQQWFIDFNSNYSLTVNSYLDNYCKLNQISPMFSSEELAQKAIDEVGEDNIIAMFKTFHGL